MHRPMPAGPLVGDTAGGLLEAGVGWGYAQEGVAGTSSTYWHPLDQQPYSDQDVALTMIGMFDCCL